MKRDKESGVEVGPIREDVERWARAVRAKDLDGVMAFYAKDVRSFDLVEPLQRVGAEAVRERTQQWFAGFEGPIGYEVRNLEITAGAEVAFYSSLVRIDGKKKQDGSPIQMWIRVTVCLRRIDGPWKTTHEHVSVPFDMKTMEAKLALEP